MPESILSPDEFDAFVRYIQKTVEYVKMIQSMPKDEFATWLAGLDQDSPNLTVVINIDNCQLEDES